MVVFHSVLSALLQRSICSCNGVAAVQSACYTGLAKLAPEHEIDRTLGRPRRCSTSLVPSIILQAATTRVIHVNLPEGCCRRPMRSCRACSLPWRQMYCSISHMNTFGIADPLIESPSPCDLHRCASSRNLKCQLVFTTFRTMCFCKTEVASAWLLATFIFPVLASG